MKNEWIWEYITDPEKVKKHNFYPFISYEKIIQNIMGKSRILKIGKKRNTENSAILRT